MYARRAISIGLLAGKKTLAANMLAQQVAALFAAGEQGAWYEPSLTNGTLFQDSAGAMPVTAVGQPVGLMLDKSGRGNAARQSTAINRPVLQIDGNGKYHLSFNGTNQWMSAAEINLTGTNKLTVVAGVRKLSDANTQLVLEFTPTSADPGSFYLAAPQAAGAANFGAAASGSIPGSAVISTTGVAAPVTSVVALQVDIGEPQLALRVSGKTPSISRGTMGTGTFAKSSLYVGARAGSSLFFNGRLYGLILRGALSSDLQITAGESYMNARAGAY